MSNKGGTGQGNKRDARKGGGTSLKRSIPPPPKRRGKARAFKRARITLPKWVVIRTKTGLENWARKNIEQQGHRAFFPRIEEEGSGKLSPLFPGYVFVEVHDGWHFLRSTFGVLSLVPSNDYVEYVPLRVMDALFAAVNEEHYIPLPGTDDDLSESDWGKITTGSFKNFSAMYIARTGADRIRVLLSFMGRSAELEIKRKHFEATSTKKS